MEGLMRVAAAVPKLRLGNVKENAAAIVEMLHQAAAEQASLAVFPELCLTGYTCGDLFFQKPLLQATEAALDTLREQCPEGLTAVVGAPLCVDGALQLRRGPHPRAAAGCGAQAVPPQLS